MVIYLLVEVILDEDYKEERQYEISICSDRGVTVKL